MRRPVIGFYLGQVLALRRTGHPLCHATSLPPGSDCDVTVPRIWLSQCHGGPSRPFILRKKFPMDKTDQSNAAPSRRQMMRAGAAAGLMAVAPATVSAATDDAKSSHEVGLQNPVNEYPKP